MRTQSHSASLVRRYFSAKRAATTLPAPASEAER